MLLYSTESNKKNHPDVYKKFPANLGVYKEKLLGPEPSFFITLPSDKKTGAGGAGKNWGFAPKIVNSLIKIAKIPDLTSDKKNSPPSIKKTFGSLDVRPPSIKKNFSANPGVFYQT